MKSKHVHASRRRNGAVVAALGVALATSCAIGANVAQASPGSPADASVPVDVTPGGGIGFPVPDGAPITSPGSVSAAEGLVFAVLNQQRASHGLRQLAWSPQLAQSSLTHNRSMAAVNVLSHQLPGEADLGSRVSATGLRWQTAAENIGWTNQTDNAGAVAMQGMFYNETAPDDGHRQNVLSPTSTMVGISVYVDGKGKLWLTEDFASLK